MTEANLAPVGDAPVAAEPRPLALPSAGALEPGARRALDGVLARLGLAWRDLLTARFRTLVDLVVLEPEVVAAADAVAAMRAPRAAFRLALEPRDAAAAWLDLEAPFALALVERLFGGAGHEGDARPLTPIEQSALRAFVEPLLARVGEAWKEPRPLGVTPSGFSNDPAGDDDGATTGRLLRLGFELRIGDTAGTYAVLLPLDAARRALGDTGGATGGPAPRAALERQLARVAVTLGARLPVAWIGAGRIAALAPGTLLPLGLPADVPVDVDANGRRLFAGTAGQHGNHLAVRITRVRTAADDEMSPRHAPGRNA